MAAELALQITMTIPLHRSTSGFLNIHVRDGCTIWLKELGHLDNKLLYSEIILLDVVFRAYCRCRGCPIRAS
jgi:hypothetical protein